MSSFGENSTKNKFFRLDIGSWCWVLHQNFDGMVIPVSEDT
jgi:hypothetical protein